MPTSITGFLLFFIGAITISSILMMSIIVAFKSKNKGLFILFIFCIIFCITLFAIDKNNTAKSLINDGYTIYDPNMNQNIKIQNNYGTIYFKVE